MNRDRKKAERRRRQALHDRRREEAVERVVDSCASRGAFRKMGRQGRQRLIRSLVPPPELAAHPSLVTDLDRLRTAVRKGLAAATFTLNGTQIPWLDVYSVLTPVASLEREIASRAPGTTGPDNSTFDTAEFGRVIRDGLDDILEGAIAGVSDLSRALYWYRTEATAGGRLRVVLGEERPQRVSVSIDGKPRPAYRVGGCRGSGGFRWADWPAEILGADRRGAPTPVFVQAHALDRLRERVPVPPADSHLSLLASLADPVMAAQDGDAVLVKFSLFGDFHVGHLIARRVPVGMLVTTFLLLTMQGTPESRRLRAALRLQRPDMEYTGLDDIRSFVNSDLAADPELAEVFRSCGCGDLLRLRSEQKLDLSPLRADTLRRHLGK